MDCLDFRHYEGGKSRTYKCCKSRWKDNIEEDLRDYIVTLWTEFYVFITGPSKHHCQYSVSIKARNLLVGCLAINLSIKILRNVFICVVCCL